MGNKEEIDLLSATQILKLELTPRMYELLMNNEGFEEFVIDAMVRYSDQRNKELLARVDELEKANEILNECWLNEIKLRGGNLVEIQELNNNIKSNGDNIKNI